MTPEEYDAKVLARYERLVKASLRTAQDAESTLADARAMQERIPFGQPIHVGHYSEQTDRNYRERAHRKMGRGFELRKQAAELRSRAESMQRNTTIFSDDPRAGEKLADKIARLEARQSLMKAANVCIRKNDWVGLAALGFSAADCARLFKGDFANRKGFPAYELTNNGANIRRLQSRLVVVEAHKDDVSSEYNIGSITVTEDVDANRVKIAFPDKPVYDCIKQLKSAGFHWSPTEGVWMRQRSNAATYEAKRIVTQFYQPLPAVEATNGTL